MLISKNIISVVSYTNAIPFVEGLKKMQRDGISIEFQRHWPSDGAKKLLNQEVNIALLPVFSAFENTSFKRITSFGITSNGKVGSVLLFSQEPLENIETIYLDYQSRTSVHLIKVLCFYYWNIKPQFKNTSPGFENNPLKKHEAMLIIGDRSYKNMAKYPFVYDLGEEWKKYTQLPFVYAAWYQKDKIDPTIECLLNDAFKWATSNLPEIVKTIHSEIPDLEDYFFQKIGFKIDETEKKGLELYKECCKKLNLV